LSIKNLSWIEDALRIERAFQFAQDPDIDFADGAPGDGKSLKLIHRSRFRQ
jgi:hypothetical protein